MPLYELVCIAKKFPMNDLTKIKSLAKQSALFILDNGGVVKQINYLSCTRLPYRMRKGPEIHAEGVTWTMQFYSNPDTMTGLKNVLKFESDVLRQNVIKVGDKLAQISGKSDALPLSSSNL